MAVKMYLRNNNTYVMQTGRKSNHVYPNLTSDARNGTISEIKNSQVYENYRSYMRISRSFYARVDRYF